MPNHVHLILVPSDKDGLRAALAPTHRRYAWEINRRHDWHGHLWQERFASFPMDEAHLHCCLRYVELNPVRARSSSCPSNGPGRAPERILASTRRPAAELRERINDWRAFLDAGLADSELAAIRIAESTGKLIL